MPLVYTCECYIFYVYVCRKYLLFLLCYHIKRVSILRMNFYLNWCSGRIQILSSSFDFRCQTLHLIRTHPVAILSATDRCRCAVRQGRGSPAYRVHVGSSTGWVHLNSVVLFALELDVYNLYDAYK